MEFNNNITLLITAYTTIWKITAIWLAESSGISAYFEIPTCENYKPSAGSWHKYHSWYFEIVSNFTRLTAREITYNNFEISLVVFMPNITTNHAITHTNQMVTSEIRE